VGQPLRKRDRTSNWFRGRRGRGVNVLLEKRGGASYGTKGGWNQVWSRRRKEGGNFSVSCSPERGGQVGGQKEPAIDSLLSWRIEGEKGTSNPLSPGRGPDSQGKRVLLFSDRKRKERKKFQTSFRIKGKRIRGREP